MRPMLTENKTGHTNNSGVAFCKNSVLTDKKVITKTVSVFVTPGSVGQIYKNRHSFCKGPGFEQSPTLEYSHQP